MNYFTNFPKNSLLKLFSIFVTFEAKCYYIITCCCYCYFISAEKIITNLSSLKQGCYSFTDKLIESVTTEVLYATPVLTSSPLPDAFGGKSLVKVSCNNPHHLEIASIKTSRVKNSLRMDSIPLKSQCIIDNIQLQNSGHNIHATHTYFKAYRQSVTKKNVSFCGVIAPNFPHPSNPNYRIYTPFTAPHLKTMGS
jgi:hypothetical protein